MLRGHTPAGFFNKFLVVFLGWPVRKQFGWRLIAERLVRTLVIVEVKVTLERREEFDAAGKVAGVNEFVLERAPQPFDEDVVERSTDCGHPY